MTSAKLIQTFALILLMVFSAAGWTQEMPAAENNILPPTIPWSGKSRNLVLSKDDPWVTPCEVSDLTRTPNYDDTMAWLKKLAAEAPELQMVSLGKSLEGRDIFMVIASKERAFTPEAMQKTGKPVLFSHAGIHSGEIDGKDAGMMLLRDMTVKGSKKHLLDKVNFLFIPILNVDGHERSSRFGRINQRGPVEMGWRTNTRNLNLNRDFGKLETPGVQAVTQVMNQWSPDLYLDLHVTDGIDYQYDITFGSTGPKGHSPAIANWLEGAYRDHVTKKLQEWGHIPGPLIFAMDNTDLSKGIAEWVAEIRYSNGYGDARHLASVLLENHSLKPYDQRVLGTYIFLESSLEVLAAQGETLIKATRKDRARRPGSVPLNFGRSGAPPEMIDFLGISYELIPSPISGANWVRWLGKPEKMKIPLLRMDAVADAVPRAKGYWVPATWPTIIERLKLHGINMEIIDSPRQATVDMYRLIDPTTAPRPYEGRVRVSATVKEERHTITLPPGSAYIDCDQPLGDLAALLLEPVAADSFFQWGYFLEIMGRTEYVEAYVMEPMAQNMLDENPKLKAAFEEKLKNDKDFAESPRERLQWFYRQTPFFDQQWNLYPVGRVPMKP